MKVNPKDAEIMKKLRRSGFSYPEIHAALDYLYAPSTIAYYTKGIIPSKNGKSELLRWLKDACAMLQPGVPLNQPPLPSGLLALWEEQSGEKK